MWLKRLVVVIAAIIVVRIAMDALNLPADGGYKAVIIMGICLVFLPWVIGSHGEAEPDARGQVFELKGGREDFERACREKYKPKRARSQRR